jgi:hypothetical protein
MRLLAVILAFSLAVAQGQTPVRVPQVVTSLTPGEMEAILREAGYQYELLKKDDREVFYLVRKEVFLTGLYLADCQEGRCYSLSLKVGAATRTTLERINAWNRDHRFSRAYLDKDGQPVLVSDLILQDGVTRENIVTFLKAFQVILSKFAAWILETR